MQLVIILVLLVVVILLEVATSTTTTTERNHFNASVGLRPTISTRANKTKEPFNSNSVDPIVFHRIENIEVAISYTRYWPENYRWHCLWEEKMCKKQSKTTKN